MANPEESVEALFQQGIAQLRAGRLKKARRHFRWVVALDPGREAAWLYLAGLAEDGQAALQSLRQVEVLNPANPHLPQALAWVRQTWPHCAADIAVCAPEAEAKAVEPGTEAKSPGPKGELVRSLGLALGRRLGMGLIILLVIIFLTYFGLDMARGNPFPESLAQGSAKTITYLAGLLQGDLGMTAERGLSRLPVPVIEVIPQILLRSLGLLLAALLIAAPLGLVLGIWAARRRHSQWPLLTLFASIVGISLPSFFAAMILQLIVIRLTRVAGRPVLPVGGFGWDAHLLLPALVLAARPLAQISRVTFVTLSDILGQDYVRTAHSKGVASRRIISRHVIRNAAIPLLTTVGVSLRFMLSSLPVVEFFFGWPGLGFTLLKTISGGDDDLTVAMLLCFGALIILVNLLLDLSYPFIDPRLRAVASRVGSGGRGNWLAWLRSLPGELTILLADNPISRWLGRRRAAPEPDPFKVVLEKRGQTFDQNLDDGRAGLRRAWLQGTVGNLPFMLGSLLVLGLVGVVIFGPILSPHSPYTTLGLVIEGGEFIVPPFAPDETYPWGTDLLGRDLLSLILSGAQQTLILASLVVLARLTVGFVLGAAAGWWNGSWLDRFLLSTVEVLAAFPTLLVAMILILALNIRAGMRPFIITLCLIGWGEIMQFVRGEVARIRPQPFIEGATAAGLRMPRIIQRHMLPNLGPALISITALEMGAVLMLLGELGFIGIFIGGGMYAELEWNSPLYHYSDVPEWGALLSNVRTYARPFPWLGLYPSLAFFVAILGFNLFGEGCRRLVETVGVRIMRLLNRYTVSLGLAAVAGFLFLQGSTGAIATYRRQAASFDGARALDHVTALATPAMAGRGLGTPGMQAGADYIVAKFQALGIQPAGEKLTYFQNRPRAYLSLDSLPQMSIEDGGPPLVYQENYNAYPTDDLNSGQAEAGVRFITFGELSAPSSGYITSPVIRRLNYAEEVLLLISEEDLAALSNVPRAGALVVATDPADLQRHHTLSPISIGDIQEALTGRRRHQDWPTFWIDEATANRLLAKTGQTVAGLRQLPAELAKNEIFELPLGVSVSMALEGTKHEKVPAPHLIGHMPSYVSNQFGGLDDHLIVVLAQYDCPPPVPGDAPLTCANDNASGVAVMLEAIRAMRDSGYQPYKTFVFIAYSGEGLDGGEPISPYDVDKFLQAKYGFASTFEIEAIVELRGLGAGGGDDPVLLVDGSLRLADLFSASARRFGLPVRRTGETLDLSLIFEPGSVAASGDQAPRIRIAWDGWQTTSHMAADTLETVSASDLDRAGKAVSLALMILGRELQY